jgi:hypothetical protein
VLGSSEAAVGVEVASKFDWAAAIANETTRLRPAGDGI